MLCLAHFSLALLVVTQSSASDVIRIGGLFDQAQSREEAAFRAAIESINGNRKLLSRSRLSARVEAVPAGDSFIAARKACSILEDGVAAIFGPSSDVSAAHVQAICDALEIPHIETRWEYRLKRVPYSVNLYPHPSSLSKAYIAILRSQSWNKFTIIYDTMDGLVRVQEMLKDPYFRITLRQLPPTVDYRPLLKEIKKSGVNHILLDLQLQKIESVLKQAQQIGLMTNYHHYFITSLDLHTLDLEDFKYGGTNITSLRLVDPSNPALKELIQTWEGEGSSLLGNGEVAGYTSLGSLQNIFEAGARYPPQSSPILPADFGRDIGEGGSKEEKTVEATEPPPINMTVMSTEVALTYDAVQLFAKALHDLDRSRRVDVTPLKCNEGVPWSHGNSLVNYMKWVQIDGFSGLVRFDADGFRRDVSLDIMELTVNGLTQVGRWDTVNGANYSLSSGYAHRSAAQSLHNKTLRIVTLMNSPYTMLRESAETLVGNDRYEGFCVDLVDEIASLLGFNYTIEIVADGQHGKFNADQQRWTGMIGDLLDQRADLAIGDLTITYDREQVVDFTTPWMNLGITILYWKASKTPPNLFSFLAPLSIDVWLYIVTSYLAVSVLLFFLGRLTPYEFLERSATNHQFSMSNSLWFTLGSLLQQSTEHTPRAVSTRLVAGIWWFFTLIMISSYTANLAAFLTVERMVSPIESAEDLAAQTKIKYGSLVGGSTWTFFRSSSVPTYQRMFSFMESQRPSVYTSHNNEGVERVIKSAGKYAFLMESSSIEYITERHCQLTQVGGLLDSKSYGIALPPGSPYRAIVNAAVLRLQELGRLHDLKQRWWKERKDGGKCKVDESKASNKANELGLSNVGGVFAVLVVGMVAALLVACFEFFWKSRKLAIEKHASIWSEMCQDFKLLAACSSPSHSVDSYVSKKAESLPMSENLTAPSLVTVAGTSLDGVGGGHDQTCGANCSLTSTPYSMQSEPRMMRSESRGMMSVAPSSERLHYPNPIRSGGRFNVHDLPSPVIPEQRPSSNLLTPSHDFHQQDVNLSCSASIQSDFIPRNFETTRGVDTVRTLESSRLLESSPMPMHTPRPLDTPRPSHHEVQRPLDAVRPYGSTRTLVERPDRGCLAPPSHHIHNVMGRMPRSPSEGELSSESSSLQAPDLPFQLINRAQCL